MIRHDSPDKTAALGGPWPECSRCEAESVTVPAEGGLCLRCRLEIPPPFPGGRGKYTWHERMILT